MIASRSVIPNPCGCVYAGTLDENYHITKLYPLVCGNQDGNIDPARPITGCNLDSIGEPGTWPRGLFL